MKLNKKLFSSLFTGILISTYLLIGTSNCAEEEEENGLMCWNLFCPIQEPTPPAGPYPNPQPAPSGPYSPPSPPLPKP